MAPTSTWLWRFRASIYGNSALYIVNYKSKLFSSTWHMGENSLGRKCLLLQWHWLNPTKWKGAMPSPRRKPHLVMLSPEAIFLVFFSCLFPLLFTLFTLCAYYLLQFWPEIAKGPSWEVSEPEPVEDIRIKLLAWMMSLKFFHGSRYTIILRKWNCEKELLNILITFIRLILYI